MFEAFALIELSHNKTNGKRAKINVQSFMDSLEKVMRDVTKQLNYMTNESSPRSLEQFSYPSQKNHEMFTNELDRISVKLKELNDISTSYKTYDCRLNSIMKSTSRYEFEPTIEDLDEMINEMNND